jgi:hypothetical protein
MSHRREIWSPTPLSATGSLNQWLTEDIKTGIVWINPQTSDQYLPQSLNLHHLQGIDFDKGCYLGQEIIARVHFLGEAKKRLFTGTSGTPLEIHTKLTSQDKTIGSILSVVQSEKGCLILAQINSTSEHIDVHAGNIHLALSLIS